MHTHPRGPDDLSDVERRLAACEPDGAGLDADAMLFAAGRASVRPGPARFVWSALTVGLAALAVVLGAWLAAERAGRLALAQRLRQAAPAPTSVPVPPPAAAPEEPPTADEPPPTSLLAVHQALARGLDPWPTQVVARAPTPPSPAPAPPVLQAGWRDALLDP
jgi:hypothetical protein